MASPEGSRWVVLTLSGDLDMSRTEELDQMAATAFQGNQVNAIFDLSDVAFMDSSALGWLLKVQERADQEGKCLRLVAAQAGSLIRLLSLTGLADRFAVFTSRMEAENAPGMTDATDDLLSTLADASPPIQFARRAMQATLENMPPRPAAPSGAL